MNKNLRAWQRVRLARIMTRIAQDAGYVLDHAGWHGPAAALHVSGPDRAWRFRHAIESAAQWPAVARFLRVDALQSDYLPGDRRRYPHEMAVWIGNGAPSQDDCEENVFRGEFAATAALADQEFSAAEFLRCWTKTVADAAVY